METRNSTAPKIVDFEKIRQFAHSKISDYKIQMLYVRILRCKPGTPGSPRRCTRRWRPRPRRCAAARRPGRSAGTCDRYLGRSQLQGKEGHWGSVFRQPTYLRVFPFTICKFSQFFLKLRTFCKFLQNTVTSGNCLRFPAIPAR